MGFLRGLGTTICSILLFLALSSFSAAYLVNNTVLNTDFMNTQIDKLPLSEMASDIINDQVQEQIPQDSEFINGVVTSIVDKQEPLIKDQLHKAINDGYAYFQGDVDTLSVTVSLAEIKQSLTQDVWQAAKDYLALQLSSMSEADADAYAADIVARIPRDAYPSTLMSIPSTLRTELVKQYVLTLGGRGTFDPAALGLDQTIEPQVKSLLEQYLTDTVSGMDDTYSINESTIGSGTMTSIRDVRKAVLIFKVAYIYLIVGMIVLAGLIFLINWKNIRASMRALGIDLLIFGILDLAGILVAKYIQPQKFIFENQDISVSVQNWVNGLVSDVSSIMMTLSIGILVVGVVLLVVSFFIKKPEKASI
jgi:hypothetical protein